MIKVTGVQITVHKNTSLAHVVLNNLSVCIKRGECVMIVGPNGAGKSSFFKVLTGQLMPDRGSIDIQCSSSFPIVQVLQDPLKATIAEFTLEENLSLAYKKGRSFFPHNRRNRRIVFQKILEKVGLVHKLDAVVASLSGGQRQVLSFIMALMSQAPILLLDEITASLDTRQSDFIMQWISKECEEEKRTALIITHDMAHALTYGNRLLIMRHGHIVADYTASQKACLTQADILAHFI